MTRCFRSWFLVGLFAAAAAIAQSPAAPPPELQRALELVNQDDLPAAISALESLRDAGEAPEPALALLGALYAETGRAADSLEVLRPLAAREDAQPAVLYNAGRAAVAIGRLEEAAALLERAARLAPQSPASRELGILRARSGRFEGAYALLKPWALANPEDTQAREVAALCALQLKRPGDAEELLSDLPQDQPRVRLLWGRVLLLKADPWGALATLKPLLEEAPAAMEMDVRRNVAEAYAALGQAADAVEVLQGHVGGDSAIALQLGQAQYQSGDLEGALATLAPFADPLLARAGQGTDPRPGHEQGLVVEYGRLLVTAGRHAEAVPFLELATRVDPGRKQAWHQLGQALAASGQREQAQQALARFQEIVQSEVPAALEEVQLQQDLEDPTGRELRNAMKAMTEGRIEEALAIARRERSFAPDDIRPRLMEGRILFFAQRLGEALDVADQTVQWAETSGDAFYLRGTVLFGMEEVESAEQDLRRALELAPDHTAAMNDLAVLLMNQGENEEARQLLERALELRPDDTMAAQNLQRLEE